MKIIHTADIHLGSKINSFPKEVSLARKEELRNTFLRMVDYANCNGVKVIIIAGDLFDSVKPLIKDREFFYSVVEKNPSIDFIYLRGNHDLAFTDKEFSNLLTFTNEWGSYEYDNVCISGVETVKENAISIYSTLNLNTDKVNIVVMHGEVGDTSGEDKVNLSKLRDKNIDYLALGHYHAYDAKNLDKRCVYAYSGCLEGRGFDEVDDKGFVLLDVEDNKVNHTFIPFSKRKISRVRVDVTGLNDAYSIYLNALKVGGFEKENVYRVELYGEIDARVDGIEEDLKKYLSSHALYVDVKDTSKKKIDIKKYENDTSITGEFVNVVYNDITLTEEEKAQVIAYGLKVLSGEEIE